MTADVMRADQFGALLSLLEERFTHMLRELNAIGEAAFSAGTKGHELVLTSEMPFSNGQTELQIRHWEQSWDSYNAI